MSHNKVVLLLGSNLGNREKHLKTALNKIEEMNEILNISIYLTSEPVEFVSSNFFCNIATIIGTHLSPIQLLKFLKKIEIDMGRLYDSGENNCYTDRIIDIDIVKYNELLFISKSLDIPHKKHLFEREFSKILLEDLNKT